MFELLKKVQIRLLWSAHSTVTDLASGGSKGEVPGVRPPPTYQNFLNFMQFLRKFVCWRLPLEGRRPILREILDPSLLMELYLTTAQFLYYE